MKRATSRLKQSGIKKFWYFFPNFNKILSDYIMELLEADKKFLCFAHHTVILDAIRDKLISAKCRYDFLRGKIFVSFNIILDIDTFALMETLPLLLDKKWSKLSRTITGAE